LPGERDNARKMPGACRRGRLRTAWMDSIKNFKTWTGLPMEKSFRMTEDRDKWRKYVHGMANPRIEDGNGNRNDTSLLRNRVMVYRTAWPTLGSRTAKEQKRYICLEKQ